MHNHDTQGQNPTDSTDATSTSKYVINTGDGYQTVRRVGDRSLELNLAMLAVDWPLGTTVHIGRTAEGVVLRGDPDALADPLDATATVTTDSARTNRYLYVPWGPLHALGVEPGDDVRIYAPDGEGLLLVPRAEDPRVRADGGSVEPGAPTVTIHDESVTTSVDVDADGDPVSASVTVDVVKGHEDPMAADGWTPIQVHFNVTSGVATLDRVESRDSDRLPVWGLVALPVAAGVLREEFAFDRVADPQWYLRDLFAGAGGGRDGK